MEKEKISRGYAYFLQIVMGLFLCLAMLSTILVVICAIVFEMTMGIFMGSLILTLITGSGFMMMYKFGDIYLKGDQIIVKKVFSTKVYERSAIVSITEVPYLYKYQILFENKYSVYFELNRILVMSILTHEIKIIDFLRKKLMPAKF